MTQLVITLKDQSYLPNIRRIVKSLQGVERVSTTRKRRDVAGRKPVSAVSSHKRVMTQMDDVSIDPLEALDSIGQLVRGTGMSSEQLIDEFLAEKYRV